MRNAAWQAEYTVCPTPLHYDLDDPQTQAEEAQQQEVRIKAGQVFPNISTYAT